MNSTTVLRYELRLISDASPGTGMGTDTLNTIVTRDFLGRFEIRSSHIKGLARAAIAEMIPVRCWPSEVLDQTFDTQRCAEGNRLHNNPLNFRNAVCRSDDEVTVSHISRTAVSESGRAKNMSLRTQEALPANAVFSGSVRSTFEPDSLVDLILRLGILAIRAVGSSRTRGSGACVVTIKEEDRSPGELLCEIDALLNSEERNAVA